MRFGDRSDEELIELARAGWAPAYAVLVHRYAPIVHAAMPAGADAVEATARVFTRAMRQLDERDASAPVAPWLLDLAGVADPADIIEPRPLQDQDLDEVWARVHGRWPDGRRRVRSLPWGRAGALAALVALAAVVPSVLLGVDDEPSDEELLEVRAVPMPDERTAADAEPDEDDSLDFTFPPGPDEDAPGTDPEPAPTPETESEPDATPDGTTQPQSDSQPSQEPAAHEEPAVEDTPDDAADETPPPADDADGEDTDAGGGAGGDGDGGDASGDGASTDDPENSEAT